MTTDIVERLRAADATPDTVTSWRDLVGEAADEIESLRSQLKDKTEQVARIVTRVDTLVKEWIKLNDMLNDIRSRVGNV